jgi:hypothetical protein
MCLKTYAHVMADLDGERRDAEAEIRAARDELVRLTYVSGASSSR